MISLNKTFKIVCDWIFSKSIKRFWKKQLTKIVIVIVAFVYAITTSANNVFSFSSSTNNVFSFSSLVNNVFNILLFVNQFTFNSLSFENDKLLSIVNFSSTIDSKLKHICFNGVIVYEQQKIVDAISTLINEYQNLFIDKKTTVNISKKK